MTRSHPPISPSTTLVKYQPKNTFKQHTIQTSTTTRGSIVKLPSSVLSSNFTKEFLKELYIKWTREQNTKAKPLFQQRNQEKLCKYNKTSKSGQFSKFAQKHDSMAKQFFKHTVKEESIRQQNSHREFSPIEYVSAVRARLCQFEQSRKFTETEILHKTIYYHMMLYITEYKQALFQSTAQVVCLSEDHRMMLWTRIKISLRIKSNKCLFDENRNVEEQLSEIIAEECVRLKHDLEIVSLASSMYVASKNVCI
jgi:hypothetical protein